MKISNTVKIKTENGFEDVQISYIGQNGTTAEGISTIATAKGQHVQGRYNIEDIDNQYAHIVGNGEEGVPSNAHTIDWEGNAWFAGEIKVGPLNDKVITLEDTNKYFSDVYIDTFEWDLNREGVPSIVAEEVGTTLYKVSDSTPSPDELGQGTFVQWETYQPFSGDMFKCAINLVYNESGTIFKYSELTPGEGDPWVLARVYYEDNIYNYEPGIYFLYLEGGSQATGEDEFIRKIKIENYTGFGTQKVFDYQYLSYYIEKLEDKIKNLEKRLQNLEA